MDSAVLLGVKFGFLKIVLRVKELTFCNSVGKAVGAQLGPNNKLPLLSLAKILEIANTAFIQTIIN